MFSLHERCMPSTLILIDLMSGLTNFSELRAPAVCASVKRQSIPDVDLLGTLICSLMVPSFGLEMAKVL